MGTVVWGLTLLCAALIGGLATIAFLRVYLAVQSRHLRDAVQRGDFIWAARVRFGVDHAFKGETGTILGTTDGRIRFEPSAHEKRRGIETRDLEPDSLRWLPGESRDLLSGVRYRKAEILIEGRTHTVGVFAVVGEPS
jgi:hypothetical protein